MAIGASLFGWVQVTAGVVAALAALGTLVFAWLTVRGAQARKRDEQWAHLLDLAADYAELGSQAWSVDVRDLSRVLTGCGSRGIASASRSMRRANRYRPAALC